MKTLLFLIVFTLLGCHSKQTKYNSSVISKEDSIELEKNLILIKNYNFNECFSLSEINTYKRMGLDIKDSCNMRINDLTTYYFVSMSDLDLNLVAFDNNRKRLVQKWVDKKEYIPFVNPPDFPDGSLNLIRSLDFYNSEDMKVYIDSIRQSEIKKLSKNR